MQEDARETMAEYLRAQARGVRRRVADELVKRADESFRNREQLAQARIEAQLKPVAETPGQVREAGRRHREGPRRGDRRAEAADHRSCCRPRRPPRTRPASCRRRCAAGAGVQGRWGEQTLRNVLEAAGLVPTASTSRSRPPPTPRRAAAAPT